MFWAAIIAAISLLIVLISGGLATTAKSLNVPDLVVFWSVGHRHAGEAFGALAIAVFAWLSFKQPRVRSFAWMLCGGIVAQALLGLFPAGNLAGAVHAVLGQMLVAGAAGVALAMSKSWAGEPRTVQDYGWPSLRSLAVLLPALIALQIALGAAFRQGLLGLMPHVIGAMLVSMFILMVGAFVLQQCKDHKALAGSARMVMVVTFVQVFFGIAIFTARSLPTPDPFWVMSMAASHVTVGALLLCASVILGMQIRKNVVPKSA